jgi:hypothetical protein
VPPGDAAGYKPDADGNDHQDAKDDEENEADSVLKLLDLTVGFIRNRRGHVLLAMDASWTSRRWALD